MKRTLNIAGRNLLKSSILATIFFQDYSYFYVPREATADRSKAISNQEYVLIANSGTV